jgi:peptidoglycan/xylan/chitin deacetylase (PgdA/CDA1 family)
MYHRVLNPSEEADVIVHPGLYVTPETFDLHMRYIRDKCRVVSFKEFVEGGKYSGNGRKATCLVTFDDGWQDNYKHAFPILKKYHIPATIFLPTDYIGTTKWSWQQRVAFQVKKLLSNESVRFDSEKFRNSQWVKPYFGNELKNTKEPEEILDSIIRRLKRLETEGVEMAISEIENLTGIKAYPSRTQTLNWEEISEMSKEGIAFGSHGISHRPFTELSDEDLTNELVLSQRILRDRHINYVPVLSYPNGDFSGKIESLARELGYRAAVTTQPGFNSKEADPLALRRAGLHQDIASTLPLFALRINFAGRL